MPHKTNFGKYLHTFPLTGICIILIWYLCLFKPPTINMGGINGFDKMVHMVMYLGTCSVFWWEYFKSDIYFSKKLLTIIAVLAPILMSGLVELAQKYLTDCRSGEWADFAANSTGVFIAAIGAIFWHRWRQNLHSKP